MKRVAIGLWDGTGSEPSVDGLALTREEWEVWRDIYCQARQPTVADDAIRLMRRHFNVG